MAPVGFGERQGLTKDPRNPRRGEISAVLCGKETLANTRFRPFAIRGFPASGAASRLSQKPLVSERGTSRSGTSTAAIFSLYATPGFPLPDPSPHNKRRPPASFAMDSLERGMPLRVAPGKNQEGGVLRARNPVEHSGLQTP